QDLALCGETADSAGRCQLLQQLRVLGLGEIGEGLYLGSLRAQAHNEPDVRSAVSKPTVAPTGHVEPAQAVRVDVGRSRDLKEWDLAGLEAGAAGLERMAVDKAAAPFTCVERGAESGGKAGFIEEERPARRAAA